SQGVRRRHGRRHRVRVAQWQGVHGQGFAGQDARRPEGAAQSEQLVHTNHKGRIARSAPTTKKRNLMPQDCNGQELHPGDKVTSVAERLDYSGTITAMNDAGMVRVEWHKWLTESFSCWEPARNLRKL